MEKEKIDILIPSFRDMDLLKVSIDSFLLNVTEDFELSFIIVENDGVIMPRYFSDYKNMKWVTGSAKKNGIVGSEANASALKEGVELSEANWVFVMHNDVFVVDPYFFHSLKIKMEEGYSAIGVCRDSIRISALHVSGILLEKRIAKEINWNPVYDIDGKQIMDVGDDVTKYCRDNGINHYCFNNSYNDSSLAKKAPKPFCDFVCDKCFNDGKLIFVHLGRGTSRVNGNYKKADRIDLEQWKMVCKKWLS